MAYHTSVYLFIFLPAVLLAYQLTPQKMRWMTLVFSGYIFFWSISGKLVIFLIGTTLLTHYIGVWISYVKIKGSQEIAGLSAKESDVIKKKYKKKEKKILTFGIVLLVAVLAYLKYYNFFVQNANIFIQNFDGQFMLEEKTLILPIGISFYTLQAISYMVDVYWGKIKEVPNLGKTALFLGFFPQIMEGPISMYSQVTETLWEGKSLRIENLSNGYVRIVWGLFKKMVVADRLYVVVQMIFGQYEKYHGVMIAVGAIAYTVQLYMEFSGCMDIIIGSGKLFGATLPENFRQPFASRNAAEFWRRWHITLGEWFKSYIFYPVSVSGTVKKWNKYGKKHFGKYITKLGVSALCLFPVWICNGLWHGARWSYIFYGMYYFTILLFGIAVEPLRDTFVNRLHLNKEAYYYRIPQILKTWIIIFTGELFFRANGFLAGVQMFKSMFQDFEIHKLWDGTLLSMGLDKADYLVVIVGCVLVMIVGMIKEHHLLGDEGVKKFALPVRWAIYYLLILSVLIFGAYGIGYQQVDMIYAGF